MIVVTIIGILASTAIPTFQKYLLKAKIAEGYVLAGSFQKAQLTHFYQYGAMASATAFEISPNGSKKTATEGFYSGSWDRLDIDPSNLQSYFGFLMLAGFTNEGGQKYWVNFPSATSDEYTLANAGNFSGTTAHSFSANGEDRCQFMYPDIGSSPNTHWLFILLGANFKGDTGDQVTCTNLMHVVEVQNGQIRLSPIIVLHE